MTRWPAAAATLAATGALLLALAGCGRAAREPAVRRLTEAQRDSAIARSSLPGASVVGRALDVSGAEAAHSAAVDSLPR